MSAYITGNRTHKYTIEFKVKAVRWSHDPARSVKEVALALDIHELAPLKRTAIFQRYSSVNQ